MKTFLLSLIKPEGYLAHLIFSILAIILLLLGIFDYLDPIKDFLDSKALSFNVGDFKVSLYDFLKGLVLLIGVFWIASVISTTGEKVIRAFNIVRASDRALIIKCYQLIVYFLMTMTGLKVLGVDLTALAVFSGAIGIGIGFGLQKITSNFISGIILLFEKSVIVGNLIELDNGTLGFVKRTRARFTLIETFDKKELMIPNEDFITTKVTNWTHTNRQGRIQIEIGVSYDSDIEKARELLLEACREHNDVCKNPVPMCYLINYGDSSVDFLVHFWLEDMTKNFFTPRSDVMRAVWKKFKEHNIKIPYPQRDLHLISDQRKK